MKVRRRRRKTLNKVILIVFFSRENRQMEDELRQPRKECSSAITISFQTEKNKLN